MCRRMPKARGWRFRSDGASGVPERGGSVVEPSAVGAEMTWGELGEALLFVGLIWGIVLVGWCNP